MLSAKTLSLWNHESKAKNKLWIPFSRQTLLEKKEKKQNSSQTNKTMSSQYDTKATCWIGNMVTSLQSVHVWCDPQKLIWESYTGLLWLHADAFIDSSSSLTEINREVAWQKNMHCLKLGVCKNKRHKSTKVCHLRTGIIKPTRLDSVLTAYWNILAVLESFMSVYKTKTQVANKEHSGFHPMTHPQHYQTCKHVHTLIQMNTHTPSHLH